MQLPFVAVARRKRQKRIAPVTEHRNAHVVSEPWRMPVLVETSASDSIVGQARSRARCWSESTERTEGTGFTTKERSERRRTEGPAVAAGLRPASVEQNRSVKQTPGEIKRCLFYRSVSLHPAQARRDCSAAWPSMHFDRRFIEKLRSSSFSPFLRCESSPFPPSPPRALGFDEDDREAVVTFTADGLNRRGVNAPLGGGHFVETSHTLDVRVARGGVSDGTFSNDIVHDDDRRRHAQSLSAQVKYAGVLVLSASMKMRSKGPMASAARIGSVSRAFPSRRSTMPSSPALAMFVPRELRVPGVRFERDQPSARGQGPSHPDRYCRPRGCRSPGSFWRRRAARISGGACPGSATR